MRCLWIVLVCAIGVECGNKVLRDENGEFSSTSSGSFVILIPAGKKIAIRIEQLDLKPKGIVKIKSPSTGENILFKKKRSTLYKINGTEKFAVSIPVNLELETRKLRVLVKKANKLVVRYATFIEGPGTCRKKDISAEVTSCDTDEVSPTAQHCNVTNGCTGNFEQSRKDMNCYYGRWDEQTRCLPKKNLITKECHVDFEAEAISSTCPFSSEEVAAYFAFSEVTPEVADVRTSSLSGKSIYCGQTCHRSRNGAWRINCNSPSNRSVYVRCIICRVVYRCGRETVIFP